MRYVFYIVMMGIIAIASPTQAQQIEHSVALNEWHLGMNVGYGGITNPLYGGDDLPLIVIPDVAYYTDTWYFDNMQLGYTFINEPNHVLSVVSEFNPEARFFVDWHPSRIFALPRYYTLANDEQSPAHVNINDIEERNWPLDAGFEYHYFSAVGHFSANALADVTSVYNGWRGELSWQYPWQWGGVIITPTLGIKYANNEMNSYFYGLSEQESPNGVAISLGSSIQPYAMIELTYPLSEHNALRMYASYFDYQQLSDSIMFEQDYSLTAFVGLKHIF